MGRTFHTEIYNEEAPCYANHPVKKASHLSWEIQDSANLGIPLQAPLLPRATKETRMHKNACITFHNMIINTQILRPKETFPQG